MHHKSSNALVNIDLKSISVHGESKSLVTPVSARNHVNVSIQSTRNVER